MVILKVAFIAGSSKQGNARRASVGWNWVAAIVLSKNNIISSVVGRKMSAVSCYLRCTNCSTNCVRYILSAFLTVNNTSLRTNL